MYFLFNASPLPFDINSSNSHVHGSHDEEGTLHHFV